MKLEQRILAECGAKVAKVLPAIKRCPPINPYYSSSDDRILEYDVDKIVFSEKTPFQTVEIIHTKSFGNILVLDNLQSKMPLSIKKAVEFLYVAMSCIHSYDWK